MIYNDKKGEVCEGFGFDNPHYKRYLKQQESKKTELKFKYVSDLITGHDPESSAAKLESKKKIKQKKNKKSVSKMSVVSESTDNGKIKPVFKPKQEFQQIPKTSQADLTSKKTQPMKSAVYEKNNKLWCEKCKRTNHNTKDCYFSKYCQLCDKTNHSIDECYFNKW